MTPDRRTVTEGGETKIVEFRPDALARLLARKVLDIQQYSAGMRLRELFETAQISPLKAQEYDRVYLDPDVVLSNSVGLVPRAGDAMKKLVALEIELGQPDWAILTSISCEDYHFTELIREMPKMLGHYTKPSIGPRVQESFNKLARRI